MRKRLMIIIGLALAAGSVQAQAPVLRSFTRTLPAPARESLETRGLTLPPQVVPVGAVYVPTATLPDAGFWQALADTTLDRLVTEMLRQNLDLQAAVARVEGARSVRTRALLDLTPSASFVGGYARQRLSSSSFPGVGGSLPSQDIWTAGFDASWELDVFGRIRHNVRAQGAFAESAEEGRRDVEVTLVAEVARAYFELRGAQEALEVARRNAENQQRTLELTERRLEAGRGTAFDTERARALLNSTLATVPTREAQVASAQYRIGVLVGRSPSSLSGELARVERLPVLPPVPVIAETDAVVRRRPDVVSAERYAASHQALVRAARADYLPRIAVGGTAGFTSADFGAIGNDGTFRYAVGPVVTWPGLNLGRVKSEVNATRAREEEAQAQYRQVVLRAMEDVENSVTRYRAARERVERLEQASQASERAAELARLRFTEGVADFLQVLDAERSLLDAQDQLVLSRTDAATAYAALYKAVGGRVN